MSGTEENKLMDYDTEYAIEEANYDLGILTFTDRYPNVPSYKHLTTLRDDDLEDELNWAQVVEKCCERSGLFGQYHEDHCPKFEDNSHADYGSL